jgi:hypothetical protein
MRNWCLSMYHYPSHVMGKGQYEPSLDIPRINRSDGSCLVPYVNCRGAVPICILPDFLHYGEKLCFVPRCRCRSIEVVRNIELELDSPKCKWFGKRQRIEGQIQECPVAWLTVLVRKSVYIARPSAYDERTSTAVNMSNSLPCSDRPVAKQTGGIDLDQMVKRGRRRRNETERCVKRLGRHLQVEVFGIVDGATASP